MLANLKISKLDQGLIPWFKYGDILLLVKYYSMDPFHTKILFILLLRFSISTGRLKLLPWRKEEAHAAHHKNIDPQFPTNESSELRLEENIRHYLAPILKLWAYHPNKLLPLFFSFASDFPFTVSIYFVFPTVTFSLIKSRHVTPMYKSKMQYWTRCLDSANDALVTDRIAFVVVGMWNFIFIWIFKLNKLEIYLKDLIISSIQKYQGYPTFWAHWK